MRTYQTADTKQKHRLETGSILLSQPFWQEEEYKRSVILVVKHDEEGSTGIILNKLSNLKVEDALPDLHYGQPLYFGGPTGKEYISFIHRNTEIKNSMHIGDSLCVGGDLTALKTDMKFSVIKFFAGFVQWDSDQLEQELKAKKWWLSNIGFTELFMLPIERLWQYKLLESGHMYGIFSDCPDPALN